MNLIVQNLNQVFITKLTKFNGPKFTFVHHLNIPLKHYILPVLYFEVHANQQYCKVQNNERNCHSVSDVTETYKWHANKLLTFHVYPVGFPRIHINTKKNH